MMQEALSSSGVPHIRQILTENWAEAQALIAEVGFPVIIKPCRGSASKNVSKSENLETAKQNFDSLLGYPGYANGTVSDAILVQEYISGTEYVVDTVSSDGEHKVVAIWRYDKREVGRAPFVYFCTELIGVTRDKTCNSLIEYAIKVLNALKVKYGPAHIELKLDESVAAASPVLIEVILEV
jgi:biotin carboxylase